MNRKHISAILACLTLLASAFVASNLVTVQAQDPIILWAVVSNIPEWGYYGGYHDMVFALEDELANIGIDLNHAMYEPGAWWDLVWDEFWNVSGDANGDPYTHVYGEDGWDIFCGEWWLNPTSYIWLDELVHSEYIFPDSWNIMPWIDYVADDYYDTAATTLDPATHKAYMWLWQERFMHNPPVITVYYADILTAKGKYIENWDDTSWWYEVTQLNVNESVFNDVAPAIRKAIGSNKVIDGAAEPIENWNPMYTLYYTEEQMNVMTKGMLYRNSRENLEFPSSGKYIVEPTIAVGWPEWRAGPHGPNTVARVHLREGITWTDGVPFNATDVAFTFDCLLDKKTGGYAYGDYMYLIEEVVVVDEYTVDFIMYEPDYDFAGYMAHGWGLGFMPYHQLKDVPHQGLKNHESAFDPIPVSMGGVGLECIGPFVPVNWISPAYVELARFDVYMREYRGLTDYTWEDYWWSGLGWGTNLPEYVIVKIIPDAGDRLIALQTLEVDICEYPTAEVEVWEGMMDWPTHDVYPYSYPASNPFWLNLDNPIISNRYVRQAIAHAFTRSTFFANTLPGWGVETAYPGKTYVTPWHESFHTELPAYEYDITKAEQYLNMWKYSQVGTDSTKGPVGDADFSGKVNVDDLWIWIKNYGTSPPWDFLPGNDIDPDFDNQADVNLDDLWLWIGNYGEEYPFPGAR